MTETLEIEKYIKCSNCKCKYHNNEEYIKIDFGFNRLGERYKCCVKCKEKAKAHNTIYREISKQEIAEKKGI